ncbi:hypothetical protein ACGH6Q_00825 [Gilliamella sp. BG2]|uniref:hypothetical protein n=1 Tax=Gilliamella sp. BG2 TaxID=3351509 RepID=UPI0039872C5A
MHYHFRHKAQGTRHKHWQTYVLSLSNNLIRRVFSRNLFIPSKLSLNELSKLSFKSPKTALLVLALLLLSSSWNVQANGKKYRAGNRSDAIMLPESPVIHYARPNLFAGDGKYAGPAGIWDPKKGFLVQSIDPDLYYLNFPTTGANNLYFDLLITGIEPEELTWNTVTLSGISATVTNVVANEYWIPDEDRGRVARVKLTGPSDGWRWGVPRLPQRFELVGRDTYGVEVVKYGFVLQKWFITREDVLMGEDSYEKQLKWCRFWGYHMARVRELSNAKCGIYNIFPCIDDINNRASSSGNYYQRRIGEGFFTEWGDMASYDQKYGGTYWTSDARDVEYQFDASSLSGVIGIRPSSPSRNYEAKVFCAH